MARLILRLAINLLLLVSIPAYANVGSISELRGGGTVKRATRVLPAARGSSIEKNDTVSTNSQGRFKITFVDSTTVNITENSRLVIDDFVFDGGGKTKGKLGLRVSLGTVRYASGGVAHGNPKGVNIRTPTATIAVRGTDFVMSVDEAGRSMVVLLPSCFDDTDPLKSTEGCAVGVIDVMTAAGVVTMNQPFQATVVENAFVPPSPPASINISMRQLNNSLQVAAPSTQSGVNIITKARSDVQKFSNPAAAASDSNGDPTNGDSSTSLEQVAVTSAVIIENTTESESSVSELVLISNEEPETIRTKVSPVYDKQKQVGWVYSSLSEDKRQAANVFLTNDTEVQVTVSQNGQVDGYNFMGSNFPYSGTGKPQGTITVTQQSGVQ